MNYLCRFSFGNKLLR